jgi:arylsulfatase A-like enzyme
MFTGHWAYETSADWTVALDSTFPTLAEVLRDHGYLTAGFAGNLAYVGRKSGLARGFIHYEDFKIGLWQGILSTALGRTLVEGDWLRNTIGHHELVNRKRAASINADFLRWLDRQQDRPFFAFINYYDAHEPYMPPRPYRDLFRAGIREPRGPYSHLPNQADRTDWWQMPAEQVADEVALYDGAIAYLDHEIDSLLGELEERGVLEDAVVIVTSDHGEHFGEQGLFKHGNNVYLPQLNVPLLILAPDAPESSVVDESVSLRDLPNTVLDLAGITAHSPFPGASLSRFWTGDSDAHALADTMSIHVTGGFGQPATPLARGNLWSIIADPFQYIVNGDGGEELYDYRNDPDQQNNLMSRMEAAGLIAQLRAASAARKPARPFK